MAVNVLDFWIAFQFKIQPRLDLCDISYSAGSNVNCRDRVLSSNIRNVCCVVLTYLPDSTVYIDRRFLISAGISSLTSVFSTLCKSAPQYVTESNVKNKCWRSCFDASLEQGYHKAEL